MSKTLLYKLFKLGSIPGKLRPILDAEKIIVSDEGIKGWYITNSLKTPTRFYKYRKEGFSGFFVITKKRLIIYSYFRRQINISVDDPNISNLYCELISPDKIRISFDASLFKDNWHGIIEYEFNTPKAKDFYDLMIKIGIKNGSAKDSLKRE